MAAGNITMTAVDGLREGWLWDSGHRSAVNGFGARRQRDGVFYYLRYRLAGRQRMLSIGRHGNGDWTPEKARKEAIRLKGMVANGIDPNPAQPTASVADTFGAEAARYLALRAPKLRPATLTECTRHLTDHLSGLAPLPLADITRRVIASHLAQIEAGSGAATRNRVRSSLSAFFRYALSEGLLPDDAVNPVSGTATADEGGSRTRVLSEAELAAIWRACGDDAYGRIVRLLILTGQRREEIGGLHWSEVEGSAIRLPPDRVKNGREHLVPLAPAALAILEGLRGPSGSPLVFGPCGSWSNRKLALDLRIARTGYAMAPWRLHDIRRTVATRMGDRLGVLPHVVEAILNHISGHKSGVAGVYNLSRYENEMRAALCAWADHIDGLVQPCESRTQLAEQDTIPIARRAAL